MTNTTCHRLCVAFTLLIGGLGGSLSVAHAADPNGPGAGGAADDGDDEAPPPTELGFFVQSGAAVTFDGMPRFSLLQLGVQHYFFRLSLAIDHDHFAHAGGATAEDIARDESVSILQVGPSFAVAPRIDVDGHWSLVPGLRAAIQVGTGHVLFGEERRRADADVLTATGELQLGFEYLKEPSGLGSPVFGAYATLGFTDILRSRYITADDSERFALASHAYLGISLHAAFYLFE
jgi:hypothetical protein